MTKLKKASKKDVNKVKRPAASGKQYSSFEKELIENVPSNTIVAKLLNRRAPSISHQRGQLPNAKKAIRMKYNSTNLKQYLPLIKDICAKHNCIVNHPKLNELKKVMDSSGSINQKNDVPTGNVKSIAVVIGGKSVTIQEGDVLNVRDNRIAILTEREY